MNPPTSGPYVLRRDEGEAIWFLGNLVTLKTTGDHTHGTVTVAQFLNPPAFAPPLHRHTVEDEMFFVISGAAEFLCDGQTLSATAGDFVLLPMGLPHTFVVGPDAPLHALQITTPSGFERFAAEAGMPALERRLPDPGPLDPAALGRTAAQNGIEILGPPPN